jgi:hypothetical protein
MVDLGFKITSHIFNFRVLPAFPVGQIVFQAGRIGKKLQINLLHSFPLRGFVGIRQG